MRTIVLFAALALGATLASAARKPVTAAQLSTCKALATALKVNVTGHTVFCPTNKAFLELAEDLGITGATAEAQLLATAKANPVVFGQILGYHIVKGVVPADKVTNGAVLTTLAPKGTLKVYRKGKVLELVRPETNLVEEATVVVPEPADDGKDNDKDDADDAPGHKDVDHDAHGHPEGTEADSIVATDLTFEGPYVPGKSTYIVHAIDEVMVPPSAVAAANALAARAPAKPAAAAAKPAGAANPAVSANKPPVAPVTPTTKPAVVGPAAAAKPAVVPAATTAPAASLGRKLI